MGELEGRDERRGVGRPEPGPDAGTYVLFALAVAFALFGISVGITASELVPVFVFMFPALFLGALGISRPQQRRGSISPGHATERELAGGGHLAVQSRGGALFYSLPGRGDPELEGR